MALPRVDAAYIDPNLKPSTPTITPVSYVDTTLSDYERPVLEVNGGPFFYNGIQLRADKLRDVWGLSESAIKSLYQQVADDGFTVVNTQMFWSNVQPDKLFNASESTYIRGGSYASQNYASSTSNLIGYEAGSESSKELTYIKFDFSGYTDGIDGAKVRFYVDSAASSSTAFPANLYGITNNSWSASSITWSHAPNHNGVSIAGTKDEDYFLASSSPSWDPILSVNYYDFDATDFVKNHCPDKIASFILQASTNDTGVAVGASVSSAKGSHPPQLVLSDQDRFDWSYVDTLIGWAEDAGLKLEFVWFGSDSTGVSMDSRVPYFAFLNTKNEKVNSDGSHTPLFTKNTPSAYGVYWYFLDKNDLTTRAQEKRAIKAMMNHVASYNSANGNKTTVVGVDVANEPGIQRYHGSPYTAWQNPETWAALVNFSSVQAFVDRTMWEFCVNLANGVKESNYPVWTRSNDFRYVDAAHLTYNEAQRATVGTSLDFVGYDPYSDSFTSAFAFGHAASWDGKDFSAGKNLPMIMENSGAYNDNQGLVLAALAGGSVYSIYDVMGSDNLGLYVPKDADAGDYSPVPRGSYVADLANANKMLVKIARDMAVKLPVGAGGDDLDFLNVFWNSTSSTSSFGDVDVAYEPSNITSVAIVDTRGSRELALLSTGTATYTLSGIKTYGVSSVQSGSYESSSWVSDGTVSYTTSGNDISFSIKAYQCIRVVTSKDVS
ncbi:hypothetical protein NKR23_g297 [Pleurostoma richardsiae]|uniref:Carbohydrate-binding module family 96 domain-containing protein n=1 Tax=Pleurostoma richardsiae TaxID=41990 RepID=A0AA38VXH9_9PEZI|nr:hypothetical protein NKR23_g297 [Pleurostoma richardsiae]